MCAYTEGYQFLHKKDFKFCVVYDLHAQHDVCSSDVLINNGIGLKVWRDRTSLATIYLSDQLHDTLVAV